MVNSAHQFLRPSSSLILFLPKGAVYGKPPLLGFPEISCALCYRPIDLETDLNADESGNHVHEDCYVSHLTGARNSQSAAQRLMDTLLAQPAAFRCPKCGSELLHVDTTLLSEDGKAWMIPLPICTNCSGEGISPVAA